jgi:predicted dehydrogenase
VSGRLRVAVVGLGFGRWLIENELLVGLGAQECELIGVCDLDAATTQAVAAQHGVLAYPDLDAVLADKRIEAVVLMVGPDGRGPLVERALAAGVGVMTTKPFETSAAAARRALEAARDRGLPVLLNSPSPTPSHDIRVIEEWGERLSLGRPIAYHASTWCSYRESADGSWYDDPERVPAAPLTRLGIYLLADIGRLFGPIDTVQVAQSRVFTGRPTADNATVLLTHADGTIGTVFSSFCIDDGQPYRLSLEASFERGTIRRDVGVITGDRVSLSVSAMVDGERIVEHRDVARESGYQWDVLRRQCRGDAGDDLVDPESIVRVVSIIEALRDSE